MLELNFIKRLSCSRSTLTCLMVGSALLLGSSAHADVKKFEIKCPIFDPKDKKPACEPKGGQFGCFDVKIRDGSGEKRGWKGVLGGKPEKAIKAYILPSSELACEYEGPGKDNFLSTYGQEGCKPNQESNGFIDCQPNPEQSKQEKSKQ